MSLMLRISVNRELRLDELPADGCSLAKVRKLRNDAKFEIIVSC